MPLPRLSSFGRRSARHSPKFEATVDDEESKLGYLMKQAIFRDLSHAEVERIAKMTKMITTPKGKVFYFPGETGEVLFLLKEGRVELYRLTPDGRKLVIDIVGPGTFFGDMACIGQQMHDSFAEAADDSLICVMSRHDIQKLMLDRPTVAIRVLESIGHRLVETTARLEDSAFKGANERVASLLLRLAETKGDSCVVEGYSHQDLAYMLGVYRETVTNALDHLKTLGLVTVSRKRVVLVNRDAVCELAQRSKTPPAHDDPIRDPAEQPA